MKTLEETVLSVIQPNRLDEGVIDWFTKNLKKLIRSYSIRLKLVGSQACNDYYDIKDPKGIWNWATKNAVGDKTTRIYKDIGKDLLDLNIISSNKLNVGFDLFRMGDFNNDILTFTKSFELDENVPHEETLKLFKDWNEEMTSNNHRIKAYIGSAGKFTHAGNLVIEISYNLSGCG